MRQIWRGGGPARVRLVRVGRPEGLIATTSEVELEVETREGTTAKLAPGVPVPPPYAWAYRVARALNVPLVAKLEPEDLGFSVRVPMSSGSRRRP